MTVAVDHVVTVIDRYQNRSITIPGQCCELMVRHRGTTEDTQWIGCVSKHFYNSNCNAASKQSQTSMSLRASIKYTKYVHINGWFWVIIKFTSITKKKNLTARLLSNSKFHSEKSDI